LVSNVRAEERLRVFENRMLRRYLNLRGIKEASKKKIAH
jgi:hypothetical protein